MSKDSLEIVWEVEDGYVGGNRPQSSKIDFSEFDACDSKDEVESLLEEIIQEEFDQQITWFCEDQEEYVATIFKYIKENKE